MELARKLSFLPYLGWDIAVTSDGFKVVEINGNTDVDLLQIKKPLLSDDRVRSEYSDRIRPPSRRKRATLTVR